MFAFCYVWALFCLGSVAVGCVLGTVGYALVMFCCLLVTLLLRSCYVGSRLVACWLRFGYVFYELHVCCYITDDDVLITLITFWLCSVTVGYVLVTFGCVGYGWLRFGYVLVVFSDMHLVRVGYAFVTFWLWLVMFWFRSGYILCAWGATWLHLATCTCFGCIGSGLFRYWLCFGCVLVVFNYGWLPLVVFGYKHAIGYVLASFWLHSVTLGYGLFMLWLWLQGYIFWLRCGCTLSLFRSIPLQTLGYTWVTFGLRSVTVDYRWVAVWLHFSYVVRLRLVTVGLRSGYVLVAFWLC